MHHLIKQELLKSQKLVQDLLSQEALLQVVDALAQRCVQSLRQGGKIFFAGNGGSAADSQHLAAELVCRLSYNRPAMAALALTTDTSGLTAIGNDYSFEHLFSRQIEALGREGDVLIAISTSGKSANILRALDVARAQGLVTVGFTGQYAPEMAARCELILNLPSSETAKIQEGHIILGHITCALIEDIMYGADYNPLAQKVI